MGLDICVYKVARVEAKQTFRENINLMVKFRHTPIIRSDDVDVDFAPVYAYVDSEGWLNICFTTSRDRLKEIEKVAEDYGLNVKLPDYGTTISGADVWKLRKQVEMLLLLPELKQHMHVLTALWQVLRVAELLGLEVCAG